MTIAVAVIGAAGALLVGMFTAAAQIVAVVSKRRESRDPSTIAWITAGNESLMTALTEYRSREQAREEQYQRETKVRDDQYRRDIADLRDRLDHLRVELAAALAHARECDELRSLQDDRVQLQDDRIKVLQDQLRRMGQ